MKRQISSSFTALFTKLLIATILGAMVQPMAFASDQVIGADYSDPTEDSEYTPAALTKKYLDGVITAKKFVDLIKPQISEDEFTTDLEVVVFTFLESDEFTVEHRVQKLRELDEHISEVLEIGNSRLHGNIQYGGRGFTILGGFVGAVAGLVIDPSFTSGDPQHVMSMTSSALALLGLALGELYYHFTENRAARENLDYAKTSLERTCLKILGSS